MQITLKLVNLNKQLPEAVDKCQRAENLLAGKERRSPRRVVAVESAESQPAALPLKRGFYLVFQKGGAPSPATHIEQLFVPVFEDGSVDPDPTVVCTIPLDAPDAFSGEVDLDDYLPEDEVVRAEAKKVVGLILKLDGFLDEARQILSRPDEPSASE